MGSDGSDFIPRWRVTADRLLSVAAIVISVGSLFTIAYQAHLTRQAQRASMMPYLMVSLSANEAGVHINTTNNGVGPALIEDVRILHEGQDIEMDPYDFYLDVRGTSGMALSVNELIPGRLIPAGGRVQMLGVEDPASLGGFLGELLQMFEVAEVPRSWYAEVNALGSPKAVIQITYSSVYGERWRIRSDALVPEEL